MSEMVERVARILEPQAWAALGAGDTLAYRNRRTSALRKARAAIEAMREPSEQMVNRGVKQMIEYGVPYPDYVARQTWDDMISAALSPEEDVTSRETGAG